MCFRLMRARYALLSVVLLAALTEQDSGAANAACSWRELAPEDGGRKAEPARESGKPRPGSVRFAGSFGQRRDAGGKSVVEGGAIPYQPWAAAKKAENYVNRQKADPLGQCFFPGVPRIMYMEYPFQIFQTPEHIAMTFEWSWCTG